MGNHPTNCSTRLYRAMIIGDSAMLSLILKSIGRWC